MTVLLDAGDAEFILQSYGRQMSKMCTQSIDLNFEDVQNVDKYSLPKKFKMCTQLIELNFF